MGRAKNKENVVPDSEASESSLRVTLRRSGRGQLTTVQETDGESDSEAVTRSASKRQKEAKGTWKTAQTALFLGGGEGDPSGEEARLKQLEEELDFAKEKFEAEERNHQKSCTLLSAAEEREAKLQEEVRALKEELALASSGAAVPGDARAQKLVNEKRKLAIEVQTLKEAKDAAEQRAKALAAANERLKKGASPTGQTPKDSPDAVANSKQLNDQMKELEASLKRKRSEMAEAESKYHKEQKNAAALKQQVQELKKTCTEKEKALGSCEKELQRIEKELSKVKDENDLLREQTPSDNDEAEELAAKLAERERELSRLQKELASRETELAGLVQELQELKKAEKQKAEEDDGVVNANHKRRRGNGGRISIQDGEALMDRLAMLQDQFSRISSSSTRTRRGGRESIVSEQGKADRSTGRRKREAEATAEAEAEQGRGLEEEVARIKHERDDMEELTKQQEKMISDLEERVLQSERKRAALHNLVQELRGNIRVFCRVRPVLPQEEGAPSEISFGNSGERPSIDVAVQGPTGARRREVQKHSFEFDQVFTLDATQRRIFEEIEPLLQSVMDGYRVCIFAYGQTGSGKTFTMEGKMEGNQKDDDDDRGVIPRCMQRLLAIRDDMRKSDWDIDLKASCVEIYNENIRDLLSDDTKKKHDVLTDKSSGETYVSNITMVPVSTEQEIYHVVRGASTRRETASTSRNAASSRSHSVLQLRIACKHRRTGEEKLGVMNMVDLAGSERVGTEHKDKERLKEAQSINKSLSCLLGVISAIATKQGHVPFRNTKLTHLLSSSLSGHGKALMFANVSPLMEHVNETVNTLRFASQVNSCQLGTGKNPPGKVSYI